MRAKAGLRKFLVRVFPTTPFIKEFWAKDQVHAIELAQEDGVLYNGWVREAGEVEETDITFDSDYIEVEEIKTKEVEPEKKERSNETNTNNIQT